MKGKIIIPVLLALLLLTSCITIEVQDEQEEGMEEETIGEVEEEDIEAVEVEEEDIEAVEVEGVEELELEEEEVDTNPNQLLLEYGSTGTIHDMEITILEMSSSASVTLDIDGIEQKLKETKSMEIFNDEYYISMLQYNYKGESSASSVLLEVTPLELEENQYILYKNEGIPINGHDVELEESNSDGYIKVNVCDAGSVINCIAYQRIKLGESEEIKGLNIELIKNYYRVKQYAIVEITVVS